MATKHGHDWSLIPNMQDARRCAKCKRVEVFVKGEWRDDVPLEKMGWRKPTQDI